MTDLNFQMRTDFYRHLFIDPASDSFPQRDVFSREQVLNLLTGLGPNRYQKNKPPALKEPRENCYKKEHYQI
jgi:hypothetical protein